MAIQRILYVYKGDCCAACGKMLDDIIRRYGTAKGQFDMNHTDPDRKDHDYDNLIRQKITTSRQLDEVDKCVLLCKECHTALHGQNINLEVQLQLEAEGTTVMHRLVCQVIRDLEKGEDQLFHEAMPLLHLLRVKSGNRASINSCLQLTENGMLDSLIEATRCGDNLRIETLDGICLYSATRLNENEFEYSQSSHFCGSSVQVRSEMADGGEFNAFVRRGLMMVPPFIGTGLDRVRTSGKMTYGSSGPTENFQIQFPDPEIPQGKSIVLGPNVVVVSARMPT